MQKITKKVVRYDLMSMKVGDSSFGQTEVFAQISFDELKTVKRIARAFAADRSGAFRDTLKKLADTWERETKKQVGTKPEPITAGKPARRRR
jgi:hypothetical protein